MWDVSSDGRQAAVGGVTNGTRLYDMETGEQIGDPFPSRSPLTFGFHTPDGRSLITYEDPAIIWDVDPASWRDKACTVAGRNMTRAEWARHMPADEPYRATCSAFALED